MHVLHVVGARPNFMKVAPVMRALGKRDLVHQMLICAPDTKSDIVFNMDFHPVAVV